VEVPCTFEVYILQLLEISFYNLSDVKINAVVHNFHKLSDCFCLVILSITERGVLNSPTMFIDLAFSFFASCVLKLCHVLQSSVRGPCVFMNVLSF
jgi:hypothetical protein